MHPVMIRLIRAFRLVKPGFRADTPGMPLRDSRVYLAARFARQTELRGVAEELEESGASVVSRWLTSPSALAPVELVAGGRAAEMALMDLEDLRRATICVAFTEEASSESTGRGGRHTEVGLALAMGLRVVLVGPREHVFHCLPSIEHYATWQEARLALGVTLRPSEGAEESQHELPSKKLAVAR
jgi:hypothetical protein